MQLSDFAATQSTEMRRPAARGLKRVRLELARSSEFRAGSDRHWLEFVAPFDANRYIDLLQWRVLRDLCEVRQYWGEEDRFGRLDYRPGEHEHSFWAFAGEGDASRAAGMNFRFGAQSFVPGDYVTIADAAGAQYIFRVMAVSEQR